MVRHGVYGCHGKAGSVGDGCDTAHFVQCYKVCFLEFLFKLPVKVSKGCGIIQLNLCIATDNFTLFSIDKGVDFDKSRIVFDETII
ncbi:hypothetical protein D3C72_2062720 [compost metagenome]